jgi:hypothetical protein
MTKKSKRVYTAQVPDDLPSWVYQIGNVLKLSGLVFSGMGEAYHFVLPSSGNFNIHVAHNPDERLWAEILKRSDDPIYLKGGKKPWLRKAERVVSGFVQQQVWARDNHCCAYCGKSMGDVLMTIDHFIPLEMGGANDTTNYISSCKSCNKDKGDMDPREWCQKKKLDYELYVEYVRSNGDAMILTNLIPF